MYNRPWHDFRNVFPVKLTDVTEDGGVNYYSGKEQALKPNSPGDLEDAQPALEFDDTNCLLYEVNNAVVDVALTPIVWARFRGMESGVPAFEFVTSTGGGSSILHGVLDGALASGGSATMSIYDESSDTGDNVTVYEWCGVSLAMGANVIAARDATDGRYYVLDGGGGGGIAHGTLDADLTDGSSATMNVYDAGGDTGSNITVYDWLLRSGESLANGTKVIAGYDDTAGRWYVISAQCEEDA